MLETWRGWSATQVALQAAGFGVPAIYQDWLQTFGEAHTIRSDLPLYWSEFATEWVSSGGRHDPRDRRMTVERPYRSPFLDRLGAEVGSEGLGPVAVHPAIRLFHEENRRSGGELLANLRTALRQQKRLEAAQAGVSGEGWTGRKRDLRGWVSPVAEAAGFRSVSPRCWVRHDGGLRFVIEIDTGGGPDLLHALPMAFSISWGALPTDVLRLDDLSLVIPGSEHYAFQDDAISGVYGIHALIGCFDIFAKSLITPGCGGHRHEH